MLKLTQLNTRSHFTNFNKMTSNGQKRIQGYFTSLGNKKQKTEEVAATATAGDAQPALPPQPSKTPNNAPTQTQTHSLQEMRANANKNTALAKQVVIKSENTGTLPALSSLLIEESWKSLLSSELNKPYFAELEKFVHGTWNGGKLVFPPKDAIFRAFNSCPPASIKVVIIGQDPYHNIGQAMGLSFSVPKGQAIPSSLRNMYKELKEDLGCPIAQHGNLEKWSYQGVLLLNAVLTVEAHKPASHAKKGWERFTEEAIAKLSKETSGVVFLLWGKYAQDKAKFIDKSRNHHILTAAHPSGLSAHRGFFGCKHFSQVNGILEKNGQTPIDWCIDN